MVFHRLLSRVLFTLLAFAVAWSAQAFAAGDLPLKVFILAGQSNMQGHAKISTLDYIGDDPASEPLLKSMRDKKGNYRELKSTWISYLTNGRNGGDAEGTGLLSVGYGARKDGTVAGEKIGPEFTFGITMQDSLKQPILIIKTAWGGKSLHTDFRPPSAGAMELSDAQVESLKKQGKDVEEEREKLRQASGLYYRKMIEHIHFVLEDIKRVYPGYKAKNGYEIAGFAWFQGWNDVVNQGVYPNRHQKGGYDNYSVWMAQFIRDVRVDLDTPDMPFVIGVMGVDGALENVADRYRPMHGYFRDAMAAPASLKEFKGNVRAVQTAPYWDMPLHRVIAKYGEVSEHGRQLKKQVAEGEITQAKADSLLAKFESDLISPEEAAIRTRASSNAAYHYNGCGKTLAQIGQAFAKALLEMQPK